MAVTLHDVALPTFNRYLKNLYAFMTKTEALARAQCRSP